MKPNHLVFAKLSLIAIAVILFALWIGGYVVGNIVRIIDPESSGPVCNPLDFSASPIPAEGLDAVPDLCPLGNMAVVIMISADLLLLLIIRAVTGKG
jgi:hypothetical protein